MTSTLPLAAAAFFGIRESRSWIDADAVVLLTARAEELAGQLDLFHMEQLRTADRIARIPSVVEWAVAADSDERAEHREAEEILQVVARNDARVRGVALLDRKGVIRVTTESRLPGISTLFRSFIRSALSGTATVSDVYVSIPEAGSVPTIAYASPIRGANGLVLGAVALYVRAEAFWTAVRNGDGRAGTGSFSVLYDRFGVRIAHSFNQKEIFRPAGKLEAAVIERMAEEKRFGTGEETRRLLESPSPAPEELARVISRRDGAPFRTHSPANGKWNLAVTRRLSAVPWTLFYLIPEETLDAPVVRFVRQALLATAAIIVLALVGGFLFSRTILEPVERLSAAARSIGDGDLTARVGLASRDELGRLGRTFDDMAESIVSARRSIDEKIEQIGAQNVELEDQAAALSRANRLLAERNDENEMFVYSVSHDLRSPLVNLQGFATELELSMADLRSALADPDCPTSVRNRVGGLLEKDVAEAIGFIRTSVLRLSGIVDALLRLSRAGRVVYLPRQVDVSGVVARVIGALNATITERGARVTASDLPAVWADPTSVEQVFANLIGNALNYLDPKRPGEVEIGHDVRKGVVVYHVRDNGLGIPSEYREKVFQAFQRLHADRASGEGIGLAIVSRIVSRHGGRVWLESTPGVGTTFFVSFAGGDGGTPE